MAGWRRAVELAMTGEEIETLTALSRSRTEAARRVERAQMLLAYRRQPSRAGAIGHQELIEEAGVSCSITLPSISCSALKLPPPAIPSQPRSAGYGGTGGNDPNAWTATIGLACARARARIHWRRLRSGSSLKNWTVRPGSASRSACQSGRPLDPDHANPRIKVYVDVQD